MKIKLSKSILKRVEVLARQGVDPIEAAKKALYEEMSLAAELIDNETPRAKKLRETICEDVYFLINRRAKDKIDSKGLNYYD